MQGKSGKTSKKLAENPRYVSPQQLCIQGFETPFERQLSKDNRWVKLALVIPWDKIVPLYNQSFKSSEGRPPINGRIILGAMIIKHIESFTDEATIDHITENMYMQYFLGLSSFTPHAPFTAPLFVAIRKRLNADLVNAISEVLMAHAQPTESELKPPELDPDPDPDPRPEPTQSRQQEDKLASDSANIGEPRPQQPPAEQEPTAKTHKGKLIMDATVAPQAITFPTDLKLLDAARQKSEEIIDKLYDPKLHGQVKPRTYRNLARKEFLNTAKKKRKTTKEIYKANGKQIRFLRRNLSHIDKLLEAYEYFPLKPSLQRYLLIIRTVYEQQLTMHQTHTRRIDNRIVNIHQPHVRPIVRGKESAGVEFGSKLQVSLCDGFAFIDHLSWEAFNEGTELLNSVAQYRRRTGYYPKEVLADKIYCTRANRKQLSELGIDLIAKPLGRPGKQAVANHVRPGERNPIEGKFGQGKLAYGLDYIRAKLQKTSESWVACIFMVLNLVNLTRRALFSLLLKIIEDNRHWVMSNYYVIQKIGSS